MTNTKRVETRAAQCHVYSLMEEHKTEQVREGPSVVSSCDILMQQPSTSGSDYCCINTITHDTCQLHARPTQPVIRV